MMDPRRIATVGILCATLVLTGWRVAGLISSGIDRSGAALIEESRTPSLPAVVEHANESPGMPTGDSVVANAASTRPVEVAATTATATTTSDEPAAATLPAAVEPAEVSLATPAGDTRVASADAAALPELAAATATGRAAATDQAALPSEAASPNSSQGSLPETPS